MRPDVGLSTISTRIATLRSLGTPPPSASAAPPADAGSAFADALDGQVQAQTAAAESAFAQAGLSPAGFAQSGMAQGGFAPAGMAQAGMAPAQLGPGVSLVGGGVIAPQLPGVAAAYGQAAGVPGIGGAAVIGIGAPTGTRSGPPAELQAFGNGRIPSEALQPLGVGDHSLWSPAARAFTDMQAAAARDGVSFGVNSSYRSVEDQQRMVDRYGLYSQGGRAAAPGSSNHGWGVSIDLQLDGRAQAWMRENGATYGFVEDVPREPWHWTFTAAGY